MLLNPSTCTSHLKTSHTITSATPYSSFKTTSISSQLSLSISFLSSTSSSLRCVRHLHVAHDTPADNKCIHFKRLQVSCAINEPLKVMISGAPASGKGTQCELIVQKFGLVHISTGDLLRAEVAAETDIGVKAKEYMNTGRLVPDEIVTSMVRARLSLQDAKEKGWLLDGYPRTSAQAQSLGELGIRPDVYIVLEVPDEILINRCVGRRLDPMTGKIYHIQSFVPETAEIKERLVTRPDDTKDKVRNCFSTSTLLLVPLTVETYDRVISRLEIYKSNVEAVLTTYKNVMKKIDGNRPKEVVFEDIKSLLSPVLDEKMKAATTGNAVTKSSSSNLAPSKQNKWRGIPTRLNNIPHSREIREYFYDDVLQSTLRAVNDGKKRLKVEISIPELDPSTDVYRIGTLMELVRIISLSFADDGKRVKVCVQGSMGEGALAGMPLQLAGTRKILEFMDWGDYEAKGTFINIGSIGGKEVDEQDDMFILVAPQNAVGNCIIEDLRAMTDAAGSRPVILINPRLKDLPGSSGIMQTMGRDKRLEYAASFEDCYAFRLLYYAGTQYPIMGAIRMSYPFPYEVYKRVDEAPGKEKYVLLSTFEQKPTSDEINDAFLGKPRDEKNKSRVS
ncbi:Adenylate kinase 5 chloroplastic [Bienertia sinuspersici]